MARNADIRRRVLGAIFLGAAILMLLAGETLLAGSLAGLVFLGYWGACFLFTFLAILVAFWDIVAVRQRARKEQRHLLEDAFNEIARRKKEKDEDGQR